MVGSSDGSMDHRASIIGRERVAGMDDIKATTLK